MKQIDLLKHIQQNKIRYTEGIYCFVLDPRTIDLEEEVLYEYIEHFINTNLLVQLNEFTYILNF